jgi:hypothetical protein
MTDDKVEVTAFDDTLREFQQAYVTVGDHKVIMGGGRNIGKTITGRIALEQGVIPVKVAGVDAGSDEHVITYTIDAAETLDEMAQLTNNEPGDYKTLEQRIIDYYANERIPITAEDMLGIYKVRHGSGKGGRGPKGGASNRLAKRRAKNKAARKARRHG